jgi:Asp/Glu/hydantoin racemase
MVKTIAFVHTSPVLIPTFTQLAKEILTGLEFFHVVDESLIRNTIRARHLTRTTRRRVVAMIGSAHEGGADAVMLTCSSIGPSVDTAREVYDFPIFRVDEAMAQKAVSLGGKIGVAATLQTTLEPTIGLLERTALEANRQIVVVPRLCEGAFSAVQAGDTERHDSLLFTDLQALMHEVDVVVLAQASMASVLPRLKRNGAPILTSPELAVRHMHDVLVRQPAAV